MIVWNTVEQDARVRKEAQTLARAGYDVTVFGLMNPGKTPVREPIEDRFSIHRVSRSVKDIFRKPDRYTGRGSGKPVSTGNAPRKNLFRHLLQIVSRSFVHLNLLVHLLRSRPDFIHAHDVNTLPTAWLAARLSRAKLVYDAHEVSTGREGYQSIRRFIACVEKTLMPRADATITTTRLRAGYFARAYGVPLPAILMNLPRREDGKISEKNAGNKLRSLLSLSEDWPIILYQGGLQQGRGLRNLLACAEHVANAYFVFIGGGRLEAELKKQAELSPARDRIHFVSTVLHEELFPLTVSADIGVQPLENTCFNHYSTDSNKLFEYMHAGLAIISSDFPVIREVVNKTGCGVLVPPGNENALRTAISNIVNDAGLRKRLQSNAKKSGGDYAWENQEKILLDLYQGLTT